MTWKWKGSYDEDESLDWLTIRNGPIVKYYSKDLLKDDVNEFQKIGYEVIETSVESWTSENFHKKIQKEFEFPEYYGGNSSAFEDSLNDKFNGRFKGLLVVLHDFDSFYNKYKSHGGIILECIATVSWTWLLAKQKLILFVQSNDPDFIIDKVGGFEPSWNGNEWMNNSRV